jgi:hypothetical protein
VSLEGDIHLIMGLVLMSLLIIVGILIIMLIHIMSIVSLCLGRGPVKPLLPAIIHGEATIPPA